MFSKQLQLPGLRIASYLLIGSFILLSACEQTDTENKKSLAIQSQTSSLLSLLSKQEAKLLIQHFKQDLVDIGGNFLYSDNGNEKKVISFQMNDLQRDSFFHTLTQLVSDEVLDSVRIRISMALWKSPQLVEQDTLTNFVPLLQFIVNHDSLVYPAYPLLAFEPKTNWTSFECSTAPPQSTTDPNILISCPQAVKLLDRWLNLPQDSIPEQLYYNDPTLSDSAHYDISNRVRYYTFDSTDTRNIYDHYNLITNTEDTCYFHLHFGLLEKPNSVPLRNVIHLDHKDLSRDSVLVATSSTYFEFSRPCPKFCNQVTGQ